MKLSELKPGDKATVEIELLSRYQQVQYFHLGGQCTNNAVYVRQANNIEVTNVIPKPAAGQVWVRKSNTHEIELLFVDNDSVFYKYIDPALYSARSFTTIINFNNDFTFVR